MLMKLCPKCKKVISADKKYCDKCQPLVDRAIAEQNKKNKAKYDKEYNKTRDPKYVEFYKSKEWRTLRAVKLSQAEYLCEDCKEKGIITLATDVHHMVPIKEDWSKRLDIDNLRCLCVRCHNKRHNRWNKT